jgi:hypothetical protein
LSYDDPGLELCIQDNSDDEAIARHIAGRPKDDRLKYTRVSRQLNSVVNMDCAVGMATGKYVCMIGDDDTILPGLFETVKWMEREGADSVAPSKIIEYHWPRAHRLWPGGMLSIPGFSGVRERVDAHRQIDELFRRGIVQYAKYKLPRLYHGIVLRERMEEIRRRTGRYFGGLSPDIYSTVALSALVSNHYVSDVPMTIGGACKESTSSNTMRPHRGELHTAPHFHLRGEYTWDAAIPAYYSGATIWAESALKAVEDMKIEGLRERFDYSRFAAYAMVDDRSIKALAWRKLWGHPPVRKRPAVALKSAVSLFRLIGLTALTRTARKLSRKKKVTRFEEVEDIAVASSLVKEYLS